MSGIDIGDGRETPLVNLDKDMVDSFALDYMHLVCQGVVKRILNDLTDGPPACKLSKRKQALLSDRLVAIGENFKYNPFLL